MSNTIEDIVLDKYIINIDSDLATYDNTLFYDFYVDIQEPIKNAMFIKILDNNALLDIHSITNPNNAGLINNTQIEDLDSIYIELNGYDRVQANISSTDIIKCFDIITLDRSKNLEGYYQASSSGTVIARTNNSSVKDYNSNGFDINDPNVFVLNPMEANLKRFNIRLLDKTNNVIDRGGSPEKNLKRFTMKLCIYYSRKKFTMY